MTINTNHKLPSNEERKRLLKASRWIWEHASKKFSESQWKMSHFYSVFKRRIPPIMFTIGITNEKRPLREWRTFATTNPVCSRRSQVGDEQRLKEEERLLAEQMNLISSCSIYISRVFDIRLLWKTVRLLQVSKMSKQETSCLKQLITVQQVPNQTRFNQWMNHNKKTEFCLKSSNIHQARSTKPMRKISMVRWKQDIRLLAECTIRQTNHLCQWLQTAKDSRQATLENRGRGPSNLLLFQAPQPQLRRTHQHLPIPVLQAQDQSEQVHISTRRAKVWRGAQLKSLN